MGVAPPSDYKYSSDTNRCYKIHTTPLPWNQAFTSCISEESSLVTINSDAEAKILTKMFAQHPEKFLEGNFNKRVIYIGFNDLLSEGIYLNIDGMSLKESGYDKWSSGQPDNYEGKEHCGSMFRDGTLNDIECSEKAMFVCEKTLTKLT
ncbi:hemolymph lipopolysaccharide-binding protein-like [Arctopsyche grandis]|uniref:hemolymph lipopolysaccharide-binding protein-like n=1 Tax=Arctopsyche grandis TaxID=121162 RepID=UPI00406D8A12